MIPRKKTDRIVFHHSLTEGGTVKSIRKWHMHVNGWADIGYHYVIGTKGEIWHGRKLGLKGAHTGDWRNGVSVGVCIIGDFRKYEPNIMQIEACQKLYHDARRIYQKNLKIDFHRPRWVSNACPGPKLDRKDFVEIVSRGAPY